MKTKRDGFAPAKKHAAVSTGEAIRMLRELKGWTQEELAKQSGINAKNTISVRGGQSNSPRHLKFIPPSSCSLNMKAN